MKLIIWDFSRTLLFPSDKSYTGSLNELYKDSKQTFSKLFSLNLGLIEYIKDNLGAYTHIIFTTGTVQNDSSIINTLAGVFKGIENVESVGFKKDDLSAYLEICKLYNVSPKETLFIDDDIKNLMAASNAGINTLQYINNNDLIRQLSNLS